MSALREAGADNLRDKLIGTLDSERKWPDATETADAIIAALPGMVPELVWEDSTSEKHSGCIKYAETLYGTYFITYDSDDFSGYFCDLVLLGSCTWFGTGEARSDEIISGEHDDDLIKVKVAANKHHRAQIMKALGLDPQRLKGRGITA